MAVNRQQLLEASVRVLVENPSASMQAIAAAAGVGRATLHRAFPARQDLLRAIALSAAADAERAIIAAEPEAGSAREALGRVVTALVPLGHRYAFLSHDRSFADDPEVRARTHALDRTIEELFVRGRREGAIRTDLPMPWISAIFDQLLFATWRGVRDGYLAPRDAPGVLLATFFTGLGAPPAER